MIKKKRSNRLKILLLTVIVISIGITAAVFIGFRRLSNDPEQILTVLGEKADISLGVIRHTATKDGVKEWTLEAQTAQLVGKKKELQLTDLSVVYFLKDGKEVYLSAKEGLLNTQSNDIEVKGNVVLINEPYEMKTERLNYRHKTKELYTKAPVKIFSTRSYLSADAMNLDLKTNLTQFDGHVEGIIADKLQM